MEKIRKIALITSTSNFERQKNTINAIDRKLKEMGGCALYVLTCYGLFLESNIYDKGEASIYRLLAETDFDGYIIESNLGVDYMLGDILDFLKKRNKPTVAINFKHIDFISDFPSVILDGYAGCCKIMEHLISEHHCSKINLVFSSWSDSIAVNALRGYQDTLTKHGIPVEERRIVIKTVNLNNGRALLDDFIQSGIEDAEATVCVHDVLAIGLCMELEARGKRVPEDMLICSLNRSTNSVVFRPDISGVDRIDCKSAEKACELLWALMEGQEVPKINYIEGELSFGRSCGCKKVRKEEYAGEYQQLVLAKIELGNQIRQMMQFNESLDDVDSLKGLAAHLRQMLKGLGCPQFVLCLNRNAMEYIISDQEFQIHEAGFPFDRTMQAVIGETDRTGLIENVDFPVGNLLPLEPKEGDLFLFYPVHHNEKVYGYVAFVNEYLPVNLYNYRICHESIGSSMENLHRQMILRSTISKLEGLHMKDAMTGLYNGFAWDRFRQDYIEKGKYCVVMLDMDGLKKINDQYGHTAGDLAITITAHMIQEVLSSDDLVTRCGGDEFRVLSRNMDSEYWLAVRKKLNEKIMEQIQKERLPYSFGVSMGFQVVEEGSGMSFEECCDRADYFMYEDKRSRKAARS